jgi:hypothetical protein
MPDHGIRVFWGIDEMLWGMEAYPSILEETYVIVRNLREHEHTG